MALKDSAIKARIITHMNDDHSTSLTRYLEHFCHLPSPKGAHLEDITLGHLIISSNGGRARNLIPIDPPMRNYTETRERMASMDKAALEGLGKSDIEIKLYEGPRGFMAVVFWVCLATMVVFCRRGNIMERSAMYNAVLKYLPAAFLRFCYAVQPLVFYPMMAIHLSEAAWMARTRLKRHGVLLFGVLWWKWTLSTFVEGYGAFVRFDNAVRAEGGKLGRKKVETKSKERETQDAINVL
jgi:hypothetical protein